MAAGLLAGVAGTLALNVTTYVDMLLRGRPASRVPAKVAGSLVEGTGLSLGSGKRAGNRRSALGALMGYATGIAIGMVWAAGMDDAPMPPTLAPIVLGGLAMAAGDLPAVMLAGSDPRDWGVTGWIADAAPHLVYGLVTSTVFDALRDGTSPLG